MDDDFGPEKKSKMAGIVLTAVGLVVAVFVFAISSGMAKSSLAIGDICNKETSYEGRIFEGQIGRTSQAKEIMSSRIHDAAYAGIEIETCGMAYVFESSGKVKYVLCENGDLYKKTSAC
jgi:hypothetical protein